MRRPLTYLGYGGGMGAVGHWAYVALSNQEWEEPSPELAPPTPPSPMSTQGPRSGPTRGRWWKLFSRVTTVLLVLILCFGLFLGYGLLNNRWYHVLAVEGGSMEPTISWGDLIVITKPPKELKPGMIVTMQVKDKIVTHRVLQVDPLVTEGDANGTPDTWKPEDVRVVGVVRFWVPKLGRLLDNVRLAGLESNAWFRDSEWVSGEVSAGQWEIAEEATGTAAADEDSPPVSAELVDSGEPPPPSDAAVPPSTEATTSATTETALDSVEPSPHTPRPNVEKDGTETTLQAEDPMPAAPAENQDMSSTP